VTRPAIRATFVLGVLGGHVGAKNGIHADQLVMKITGRPERDPFGERLLRKAIEELRGEGFHICGTPASGYYLAANDDELNRTCAFLYARAMASLTQVAKMKKVSLPDLRGQLKLPT
jgi:hypothetical protein